MSSKFLKSVSSMSFMTLISRVLGLVREMCRAHFLGTSIVGDAFVLAFSLPNLFRRLTAEGAMMNAFVPEYKRVQKEDGEERSFIYAFNFFLLLAVFLAIFCIVFVLLAPTLIDYFFAAGMNEKGSELTTLLARIMFPYIFLISLAALCQGVLNANSLYWPSAFTPVILNLTIISAAYFFSGSAKNPAVPFALGVVVGGTLQLLFQIPFVLKVSKIKFEFFLKDKHILQTLKNIAPGIFGAGIYQINIVVGNIIATFLETGSLSVLSFSNRLIELVLGVFIVSIATVSLTDFSTLFLEKEWDKASERLNYVLRLIFFITIPVIVGLIAARGEIVEVLFKRGEFNHESLAKTAITLLYHAPGILFIGLNRVLLSIFYAQQNYKTPVQISFFTMILNLSFCLAFSQFISFRGIALANTISQAFQSIVLVTVLLRQYPLTMEWKALISSFTYLVFTSAIMYFGLFYFDKFGISENVFLILVLKIVLAVIVFLLFSLLNPRSEIRFLKALIRKK